MKNCLPLLKDILAKAHTTDDDYLLHILKEIQDVMGYLSKQAVSVLSEMINIPEDEIYDTAVATGNFRFYPQGKHHIKICCGTACRLKGSQKILQRVCDHLDLDPGEMTPDEKFSLEIISCQDACCLAPFTSIGGDIYLKTTPENIVDILDELD